jgi:tRNA1(Val) A37 N6-methylase TrmN6
VSDVVKGERPVETFLGGRVRVDQPLGGFRSGLDAVMLAAAVPAKPGQAALELGAGSGALSLCLAVRVPHLTVTGVEIDSGLATAANRNAAVNGIHARVSFFASDIFALPPELKREFDHVLANPPFHGDGQMSPDPARAMALADSGKLANWLKLGLQRTVSGGYFTLILRADRLDEALSALPQGGVSIYPLWPRAGEPAKRVILLVRKGSAAPIKLLPGLILHAESGDYTPEADAVLRCGEPLALFGTAL